MLVVKIVFRIVIFRKILDGDPTKITKISQKIDKVLVEGSTGGCERRARTPRIRGVGK